MDLFDLSIGQRLKEQGMAKAAYSSWDTSGWLLAAQQKALELASVMDTLTIEDVLKALPHGEEVNSNCHGSVFGKKFQRIGFQKATKVSRHCGIISVWKLKD